MARPVIHQAAKRTNIILDESLHVEATKRAKEEGFNSFSEYVARLLVADMNKKRSVGHRVGRTLKSA